MGPDVQRVFSLAIELPPEQREALVRAEVGDDTDLYQEVVSLLDAYEEHRDNDFLEKPVFEVGKLFHDVEKESRRVKAREETQPVIPGYSITENLGNGAMGQVFLAFQEELARSVAVKVLRPQFLESHYREFAARFRNECKVLAMLPHDNIAKIYEVGTLDDARPFFTMEYLEGAQTVQQYCDQIGADIPQRLRLFLKICDGVAFAHRNTIVHRDLKPSNILIDPKSGQPKIIDFGLAKSILPHEAIDWAETPEWRPMGTPPFISPEQLRRSEGVVPDTRSDVYALGMLLYVLLTDIRPFLTDSETAFDYDLLRKIVEEPVAPPSGAFLKMAPDRRREVAARCAVSPAQLVTHLKRDLDWIVLKAVQKDPDQRYQSVLALADDLRRYLALKPVKARPDVWYYQMSKFVRRHWLSVLVGTVFAGSLLALTTIAFFNNQKAIRAAERTRAVLDHLKNVVDLNDPLLPEMFQEVTGRAVASQLQAAIEEEGDVESRLAMMEIHGSLLYGLGDYRLARDRYSGLFRAAERRHGSSHERTLRAGYWAGICSLALAEAPTALAFFEQALPDIAVLNPRFQIRLRRGRVEALRQLGRSKSEDLVVLLDEMVADLAVMQETRGAEAMLIAITKGHVYRDDFQFKQAEAAYEQALTMRMKDGRISDPLRGNTYNYLAANARLDRRLEDALEYGLRARELLEASLRPDHPYLLHLHNNLGNIYSDLGRDEEAEWFLRKALRLRTDPNATSRPLQTNMLNNLADLYLGWQCPDEAEVVKVFELTLRAEQQESGDINHWASLLTLAEIYQDQGRHAQAAFHLETVVTEWPLDSHTPYLALALSLLARSEAEQGNPLLALRYFDQAAALSEDAVRSYPEYYCDAVVSLLDNLPQGRDLDRLRAFYRKRCTGDK